MNLFTPFDFSDGKIRVLEPMNGKAKDIRTTEMDMCREIKKLFENGYKLRHGVFKKDPRSI